MPWDSQYRGIVTPLGDDVMTDEDLVRVSPRLYGRVWKILQALDERERHFNNLQTRYRALASTWLLASFTGIGFLFTTRLEVSDGLNLQQTDLAIFVAVAGQVGLSLLWVLDLLVYHDLLVASYAIGSNLEKRFDWLPPIRKNFSRLRDPQKVRWRIAQYYLGGIGILGTVAMLIAVVTAPQSGSCWVVLPVTSTLIITAIIFNSTNSSLERGDSLKPWLEDLPE